MGSRIAACAGGRRHGLIQRSGDAAGGLFRRGTDCYVISTVQARNANLLGGVVGRQKAVGARVTRDRPLPSVQSWSNVAPVSTY